VGKEHISPTTLLANDETMTDENNSSPPGELIKQYACLIRTMKSIDELWQRTAEPLIDKLKNMIRRLKEEGDDQQSSTKRGAQLLLKQCQQAQRSSYADGRRTRVLTTSCE